MESDLGQDGAPRPSYVFSADPLARPSEVNLDGIKLDLSHEFSLVASNTEASCLESKDYLQVCLRIRPFTQSEKEHETEGCVQIVDTHTVLLKEPQSVPARLSERSSTQMTQKFSFSKVFGPETTQQEFFQGCVLQPVQDLLRGQSRLLFTYGLTNSGKTYTFQGTEENVGILPRTLNVLFDNLQQKLYTKMNLKPHRSREYLRLSPAQEKEEVANKAALLRQVKEVVVHNDSCDTLHGSSVNSLNISECEEPMKDCEQATMNMDNNIKFSVWVSFFEIYNECIYDLFVPLSSKFQKRKMLRLSQDVKGYSFIKDLQWIQVSDSKEGHRLLKLGIKHRSVAFTKLNHASSRSHSIFTVRILHTEDAGVPRVKRVSELSLCDLAGSERSMKTQNEGERLRETGNINTSLLTLGKCIGVLKNSEKCKFQQHVPFRESKLTHYFQSFFNGKGKIYMIVNISQCCFAYDETLSVLKFSAIAQKVCVTDTLKSSQEKSFAPVRSSQDTSVDANNSDNKSLSVRRAAVSWESTLDDVVEDEGLGEDTEQSEEKQSSESELTDADPEKTFEDAKTLVTHEEKRKLLELIEDLKQKLISERKEKLTLELKIREEVTEEFTQYLAQREADFKETLLQEREISEENAECRVAIFKDLVGKSDSEEPVNRDCAVKTESKEAHNYVGIEDFIDSLQDDVSDIRKQTEIAHLHITSLADPQEAVACLELKFNQVKAELAKTKEELIKTQEELKKRQNEPEINLNSRTEDLEESNKVRTAARSPAVNTELTCSASVGVPQDLKTKTCPGGKRLNDSGLEQEEPPAKRGPVHAVSTATEHQKETKEQNDQAAQESRAELRRHLRIVDSELRAEREGRAELNKQVAALQQELFLSEKKSSSLRSDLQQIQLSYDNVISELCVQRSKNQEQENKIIKLSEEVEITRRNMTNNVSQMKLMQAKMDVLRALVSASQASDADWLHPRGSSRDPREAAGPHPADTGDLVTGQATEDQARELSGESSFHSSMEAIWEECKGIVKSSSQKSRQIQELEQHIRGLQEELKVQLSENNQVKEREGGGQCELLREKERPVQPLKGELREKAAGLGVHAQLVVAGERALSELTQDVTCYKIKIKELESMLETQKDEHSQSSKLEQEILEKESVISKLEADRKEFQANLQDSVKITEELRQREVKLKEEVTQLTNSWQAAKRLLQLQEEEKETNWKETERLKEELSANSAVTQALKADLEKKEEGYAELKVKLADAKKQIEQVQKEVSVMRDEEKSLRIKISELEKKKNQYCQEIDMRQRTIQQLKEQLSRQVEETVQQQEKMSKEISIKEKIIEDMRFALEEQEQTQVEQDQALEAQLEEVTRLTTELEKWKANCRDLEAKGSKVPSEEPADDRAAVGAELSGLQAELQASEQKYRADRKKWSEEKMMLLTQARDAENLRNREMRKYAEDRERCLKQQSEAEMLRAQLAERESSLQKWREERDQLVAALEVQLAEKESSLQKWREERDQLVAALEVQLGALAASSAQKDHEAVRLRESTVPGSHSETRVMATKLGHESPAEPRRVETEPQPTNADVARKEAEDESVVLDSCEVSTENSQSTRFPKPELEIQFTPLQPNKMAVRRPGCSSPVTVKMPKARKRRSSEVAEVSTAPPSKAYSLRSQASTINRNSAAKKKDGTLQKFGDFLQHSPTILQSKAKKIIETMSSSRPPRVESSKEDGPRPKRAKRRLYTSQISSPLSMAGQVIVMDQKVKESDHQILRRRLRTKTAK
ncbi:kinesin-like protein KIF20B isoform X2 [Erinaceus europaeus]|uniref:Kinesin-like protein KIF20B isoform X2 n=1 Tax=Erinaceus europaeus TaxID=9365 RepID=A0ABM3W216_ERIEU|nr:kinesin-like protein KIF20B isoform X2 [Erinaceus europaeus]